MCFLWSRLEEVSIPCSVRSIEHGVFSNTSLKRVRFLGASEGTSADVKVPPGRQLVIGEEAFAGCEGLKQVIFDPGSTVTEIQSNAF